MKKEKYFRDELQHMFIYYAIVPAVVFTLLCGVVFMVALIHGRRSITISNNGYVAGELERVLVSSLTCSQAPWTPGGRPGYLKGFTV